MRMFKKIGAAGLLALVLMGAVPQVAQAQARASTTVGAVTLRKIISGTLTGSAGTAISFPTVTATSGFLAQTGCTTVTYSFTTDTSTGVCQNATGFLGLYGATGMRFVANNTTVAQFDTTNGYIIRDTMPLTWGSSGTATPDLRIRRSAAKTFTIDDNAGGALTNFSVIGPLSASTTLKTGATTVASLPTCNSGAQGMRYVVTDANATTFLSTVAAGGANVVPVVCDGTNWKIG